MKIKILTISLLLTALNAYSQDWSTIPNLDAEEDTADVTTLNDILKIQQNVYSNNDAESHYQKVWGHRSYFNLAKNSATMTSTNHSFKSDIGGSMQSGTSYRLHKKPIANMVSIALDYAWLDLSVNHYDAEPGANGKCYNSVKSGSYYDTPWSLEKFEGSYGMNIGPSITIAPFTPMNVKALDFIKLNAYFHIGYNVSALYMNNKKEYDSNPNDDFDYKQMANNLKLMWGHGLSKAFGFSIFWKGIGVGYEHRTGNIEYQHINTDDFGKDKTKFTNTMNRIYITFRT